jgi:hypothetical protein
VPLWATSGPMLLVALATGVLCGASGAGIVLCPRAAVTTLASLTTRHDQATMLAHCLTI